MNKVIISAIFIAGLTFLFPSKAEAYIDPGSGSFFMQMIAAGMIGAAFHFRRFFAKLMFWKHKEEKLSPLSDKK